MYSWHLMETREAVKHSSMHGMPPHTTTKNYPAQNVNSVKFNLALIKVWVIWLRDQVLDRSVFMVQLSHLQAL